jgi:hypothetical protein
MPATVRPPDARSADHGRGALLGAATASALVIWALVAVPVLSGTKAASHARHFPYVFAHALGGTAVLFLGASALYVGRTRRLFRFDAWVAGLRLIGGALGAGSGLLLSILNPHPLPGVGVATGVLALTWLAVAAMAYRAAPSPTTLIDAGVPRIGR